MKKLIRICSILVMVVVAACSKTDNDTSTAGNTSLELTLKDDSGQVITDGLGYARLYGSVDDWSNDLHQIGEPKFADAHGKITFAGLSAGKYYWRVENGCRNNFTTAITTPQPLVENMVNKADVPMVATFSLSLRKNAAYATAAFYIYINDGAAISIPQGQNTTDVANVPAHSRVRVLQINGPGTAADTVYSDVTGACGQTYILYYPG